MTNTRKLGGTAIVTAVLLMLTRMIPIFASGAITFQNFPPDTVAGTADLAINARPGWELSHLMLLAALVLFFIGYVVLFLALAQRRQGILGISSIVVLGSGLLFYAIAGVVDGFLVPVIANRAGFLADIPVDSAHAFVGLGHETALAFFGHAQTGIVLGIGLFSVALWRAKLLNRRVVAAGAGLSGLALVGLLAGVFGDYWRTFATAGPTMLLFFFWQLALGVAMVQTRTTVVDDTQPRLQENAA
jgi:hypothetical protein